MEFGDKLQELNMTADEMQRLTKAFKDDTFREMLRDYAQELSDPENKKRYEEEIKLLEQERGNTIEFIHPEPFRTLRTSVNGQQKCFINICSNEKVGKPSSSWEVSQEGHRGQRWSLPHSLHPGRKDIDSKGNTITIYDVIFHPDTIHIANKNRRFMDMVDSTAIQGIQDAFNVTLDKNNVKKMSTKYKGTPQPCVIRKPIPGYKATEPSEKPDPLAFPYPDAKQPKPSLKSSQTESPIAPERSQMQQTKETTRPNHTVKYRSFIDLQDYRCSRDSARSPRPKEIVVTIDMPLVKAVKDVSLEVTERSLLLESEEPAYRLELPLAYPVDGDRGQAKFIKQRGQLVVTLPVLPSKETFDLFDGCEQSRTSDNDGQEETSEAEEDVWKEREREGLGRGEDKGEEMVKGGGNVGEEVEEGKEEEERVQEEEEEQMKGEKQEAEVEEEKEKERTLVHEGREGAEDEGVKDVRQESETLNLPSEDAGVREDVRLTTDGSDTAAENRECQCDTLDQCADVSAEENSQVTSPDAENLPVVVTAGKEVKTNLNFCLESAAPETSTSDIKDDTLKLQVETAETADAQSLNTVKEFCISHGPEESATVASPDEGNMAAGGGPGSEEQAAEKMDEDDLQTEQTFQSLTLTHNNPPPVVREIDEDGNENVISDHSTSAGFNFQNSLMFELD
ncbi:uncharacterized protein V6R79_002912 [Siganus canaliculatus]